MSNNIKTPELHKLESSLVVLSSEIQRVFSDLTQLDTRRFEWLQQFFHMKGHEDRLKSASEILLYIKKTFPKIKELQHLSEKILGYVILMKKEGHLNPKFQDLLTRYQLMMVRMEKLKKARKKQIFLLETVVKRIKKVHGITHRFIWWRVKKSMKKEHHLMALIKAIYYSDKKKLDDYKRVLDLEVRKEKAVLPVAFAGYLLPGLGTATFLLITEGYEFANQFTKNYNALLDFIEHVAVKI